MSRVLVIDTDAAIRQGLAECLALEHYEVQTAGDLLGALRLLAHHPVDVILADLYDARPAPGDRTPVHTLTSAAPGVPLVLTTTMAEAAGLETWRYGLAGILIKPFEVDQLYSCLGAALSDGHVRKELPLIPSPVPPNYADRQGVRPSRGAVLRCLGVM
jgi:DNA-binding NtrC family response regulator